MLRVPLQADGRDAEARPGNQVGRCKERGRKKGLPVSLCLRLIAASSSIMAIIMTHHMTNISPA